MKTVKEYRAQGFTIIELLIVIVVIAILATITIVAYTGITAQANASAALGNAQAVRDYANTYYAQNGTYPVLTSGSSGPLSTSSYATLPTAVTVNNLVLTANNSTIKYGVVTGNAGVCIGYYPVGGAYTIITTGSATGTFTNTAGATCS